ncbi:hypothetical protein L4D77_29040 [Photobacterium frigidiphilum]|uniref:hypothetical protein n=1 Tax=Photobacterium frigidiphilum TaxID=264736 RepID=UPI003D0A479B
MKHTIDEIHIDMKEVKLLASLHSMVTDLKNILVTCKSALNMTDSIEDQACIDAIGTAGLIKYMRCFHSGKRSSLSIDDLSSFTEEERKAHQYFKALRDKHVAHSVSSYEQCQVKGSLAFINGARQPFTQLLPASQRVMFSKNNVWAIQQLVIMVLDIVNEKITNEEQRVLKILNGLPEREIMNFKKYVKPEIEIGIQAITNSRKQKA